MLQHLKSKLLYYDMHFTTAWITIYLYGKFFCQIIWFAFFVLHRHFFLMEIKVLICMCLNLNHYELLIRNISIADITSDGQDCLDECAFRGYSYAWCNTEEAWGYCTPSSFLGFLSRLHTNGPGQLPTRLTNASFDNQEINRLLVDDKPANVFDLPSSSSTTTTVSSTSTTLSTTLLIGMQMFGSKTDFYLLLDWFQIPKDQILKPRLKAF